VTNTGFVPHKFQGQVNRLLARFSVLICHRRWGKTVNAVNLLIDGAMRCKLRNARLAYIAPLRNQAKTVAWDYLKYYTRAIPGMNFNEADLRADFPNGARISLYGGNHPDSLRGIYLDGVVFDEVAQMPYRVWTEIIRPALADRLGWALFIGTPQGKNILHDLYHHAEQHHEWFAAMYKASETGLLDANELASARSEMDPDEYEQEFECSFTAAIKGAYYAGLMADAKREGRITRIGYDPALPLWTAWDLGMSDSTSIWFVQPHRDFEYRVIDYYEASGEGLGHYAGVLTDRQWTYAGHIGPHDIRVRELGTGKSRFEVASSLGIQFDIAPNISIADGINAVRNILPRCWFNSDTCSDGIDALTHYRREFVDKTAEFRTKPLHDWTSHGADSFRYFAVGYRPPSTVKLPRTYA
jgi:phage terminase large subunit